MPAVLFVCRHNACRSQIAEALGRKLAPASWVIDSAGSHPTARTDPKARAILRRHGLGMRRRKPQGFAALGPRIWDFVVDISCEGAGRQVPAKNCLEWDLADPLDGPMDLYKRLYEELESRIRDLFRGIQAGLDDT
ncbi:MAG: low molecular weight phosphatase family protein [Elusimicrobia bacterium]|nr:low molecular weight phosphatase family protein [Elusimicrobiota bacterium]